MQTCERLEIGCTDSHLFLEELEKKVILSTFFARQTRKQENINSKAIRNHAIQVKEKNKLNVAYYFEQKSFAIVCCNQCFAFECRDLFFDIDQKLKEIEKGYEDRARKRIKDRKTNRKTRALVI